jgi:hypothetical protein
VLAAVCHRLVVVVQQTECPPHSSAVASAARARLLYARCLLGFSWSPSFEPPSAAAAGVKMEGQGGESAPNIHSATHTPGHWDVHTTRLIPFIHPLIKPTRQEGRTPTGSGLCGARSQGLGESRPPGEARVRISWHRNWAWATTGGCKRRQEEALPRRPSVIGATREIRDGQDIRGACVRLCGARGSGTVIGRA